MIGLLQTRDRVTLNFVGTDVKIDRDSVPRFACSAHAHTAPSLISKFLFQIKITLQGCGNREGIEDNTSTSLKCMARNI